MTTKQAGLISWFIQKYFSKPELPVKDPGKKKDTKEEEALAKEIEQVLPVNTPEPVKAAYVRGFIDKLSENKPVQFLSDMEREAQQKRLVNQGEDAGKGLQLSDLRAKANSGTGVDKSLGISYDYGTKEAGLIEQIGKYSTPIAERIQRFAARIKQQPETAADTLSAIKGTDVGANPAVDRIYKKLGKQTAGATGVAATGGLGLASSLELQDTEADA